MQQFQIPYGRKTLTANFPDHLQVDQVTLQPIAAAADPIAEVSQALAAPLGGVTLEKFSGAKSVAIAINDKTRPVPHHHLLTPLLERSDMDFDFAKKLLLNPVISLDEAIAKALSDLPSNAHIAMMPIANATIPVLRTQ